MTLLMGLGFTIAGFIIEISLLNLAVSLTQHLIYNKTIRSTQKGDTMKLNEAKKLKVGQTLYHAVNKNADGTPHKWIVNSNVRRWKLDPDRVEVQVKHGLHYYGYINNSNLNLLRTK